MTPFGEKLRALREARGVLQREMAAALEVSPAYLSALEHGRRGAPSAGLIHQISEFFGLIWDDADELRALARLSRPRLKLNAAGLTPEQTALGNRMARELRNLDPDTVAAMHALLDAALAATPESPRPRAKTRAKAAGSARGR
jgi:transcriptional regulator with XRE-family HTH domain